MKLKDARDHYYFHSGKTSDLIRQLGLAGIAVVWLFKKDVNGLPSVPSPLIEPLLLIVAGLACDLMQYVVATGIWGRFQRVSELAGLGDDDELVAPRELNWPSLTFFCLKEGLQNRPRSCMI